MRRAITAAVFACAVLFLTPLRAFSGEASYTYNYDYWGDVQDSPDLYAVNRVFTSADLGLDVRMKSPEGLYVSGNLVYICDTGNNRIIELERTSEEAFSVSRIIDSFRKDGEDETFRQPSDIAVSGEGDFYIADRGHGRILRLDQDLNYVMQFSKPVDNTLDPKVSFQPAKIAIDTAGRVYCVAAGINKGLIKYENDGTFSGFVGATPVTFEWWDYVWKRLATQEQRARMESFVPTEYSNLCMDREGFIYGVIGSTAADEIRSGSLDVVRKLNLIGNDILVRNGEWPVIGDLYMGTGGGYTGPSWFSDVTVMDNDIYVCLDRNRGRLFGYDDQGRMVFAFGGNGNMDGYFRRPVAIGHMGHDLFVLDTLDCSLTSFVPTPFGELVYQAVEDFDRGDYLASSASWEQVMALDGNYDLAYIGIGRSLLRQKRYKEAMDYFEIKYDAENYSKAYKQYRKIWVESHILWIIAGVLVLALVPLAAGRVRGIRQEIATADIFPENRGAQALRGAPAVGYGQREEKTGFARYWDSLKFSLYCITHPLDGFWDLTHERRGTMAAANTILVLALAARILKLRYTSFIFMTVYWEDLNIFLYIASVLFPLALWVVGNWGLTTLFDGKGRLGQVYMATCYGLTPYPLIQFPLMVLSRGFTVDEAEFYAVLSAVSLLWAALLIVAAMGQIHEFSAGKNLLFTVATLFSMLVMVFILMLFFSMISQGIAYFISLGRELLFRM